MHDYAHRSAPLSLRLFDAFWRRVDQDLRDQGEHKFADYFKKNHLDTHDGLWTAPWHAHSGRVEPPFSAYSSNTIESFWNAVDMGSKDKPKSADVLDELTYLERSVKTWRAQHKFADIRPAIENGGQGRPPPSKPAPALLKGRGTLGDRGLADGGTHQEKQLRRLTTQGIIEMAEEGNFVLEKRDGSGNRCWVCPKYDGNQYSETMLENILHALSPAAADEDRERAWRDLGIRIGAWHGRKFLAWARF